MQLSRPWTRAIPSATDSTVPTSARSAPSVSRPSILSLRMLAISSGLISTFIYSNLLRPPAALHAAFGAKAPHQHLCRFRDFLSQSLELVAHARVQDHVANLQYEPAEDVLVHVALQLDRLAGLLLDLLAELGDDLRRQLHGARQPHLEAPLFLRPHLVESPANAEDRRHPVLLGQELEEVGELLLGAGDQAGDSLALLGRREVRAEQEHLEVAVLRDRVRNLPELVVDLVELALVGGDLEEGFGVYASDLLHQDPESPFPSVSAPAGERAEKSTSFNASSISRR